jgi:hypothetical protein
VKIFSQTGHYRSSHTHKTKVVGMNSINGTAVGISLLKERSPINKIKISVSRSKTLLVTGDNNITTDVIFFYIAFRLDPIKIAGTGNHDDRRGFVFLSVSLIKG